MAYKHVSMDYTLDIPNKTFFNKYVVDKALKSYIGAEGVEIMKELLDRLRRSGDLDSSWKYRILTDSVEIYSEDWAAASIQSGFNQPPPKDEFLEWMNYKPEFSGMDTDEKSRAAFAIRRSMLANNPPGTGSTLRALPPTGERRYQYLREAGDAINDKVREYFR